MRTRNNELPAIVSVLAIGSALAFVCGLGVAQETARPGELDPYVGDQMCQACHDVSATSAGSPHAPDELQAAFDRACQSCHGPGRAHVQSPNDPDLQPSLDRIGADTQKEMCGSCHGDLPVLAAHGVANLGCSSCHAIHNWEDEVSGAARQLKCIGCHSGSQKFDLLHEYDMAGMKANEISCRSCHSPIHQESGSASLENRSILSTLHQAP